MSPFVQPLRIVPRVSRAALHGSALLHTLSVCLVLSGWPWSPVAAVCVLLLVLSAIGSAFEITRVPQRFAAVLFTDAQTWVVTDRTGKRFDAMLRGSPVVTVAFVIVPFAIDGERYTWIASADTTPRALLRRLRVRLRFEPAKRAVIF